MVQLPFAAYLAGFWPGVMTTGSLSQWSRAVGRVPWTDVPPPLSTVGLWVAAEVGSPAVATVGQSFFLAWAVVSFLLGVSALGAPAGKTLLAGAAVALAPSVGLFSVTLGPHVPFTAAVLMLGGCVLRMMAVRLGLMGDDAPGARVLALRGLFARAAAWATLAAFLGHHGALLGAAVLAAVALALPDLRKRAAAAALLLPIVVILVRAVVLPGLGVSSAPASVRFAAAVQEVGAFAKHAPSRITEEDWNVLRSYAPPGAWASTYDCTSTRSMLDSGLFKPGAVDRFPEPLLEVRRRLMTREPSVSAAHRLCAGEAAWHPFGRSGGKPVATGRGIERNTFDLKSAPLHEGLGVALNEAVDLTELRGLQPFFHRAPIWISIAFLVLLQAAWRSRRPLWLLAAAPLLAQQGMVVFAGAGRDPHAMAAAGIAAVLLLPLFGGSVGPDPLPEAESPTRRPWRPGEPRTQPTVPASPSSGARP